MVDELQLPDFKRTQRIVFLIPLYLFQEFFGNFVVLLATSLIATEYSDTQSMPILVTFVGFTMYHTVPWILTKHFEAINDRIEATLKLAFQDVKFVAQQGHSLSLARLRLQHEQLVDSVLYLERAFGLQVCFLTSYLQLGKS
jgi:hypothetical protein